MSKTKTKPPLCQYCNKPAALVDGAVVHPRRQELAALKYWRCADCDAHVGCHKPNTWMFVNGLRTVSDGTLPLGNLANAELREAKTALRDAFDPIWKAKGLTKRDAYAWLAKQLDIKSGNCNLNTLSVAQCREILSLIKESESC